MVGAVLSQRQGAKSLLYPVAFLSCKLSTAGKKYDVGDRELLAIKAAVEEWRYLLKGAAHPILVYTDHKTLKYLRTAKRLKPQQARWALFLKIPVSHYIQTWLKKYQAACALPHIQRLREIHTPQTLSSLW